MTNFLNLAGLLRYWIRELVSYNANRSSAVCYEFCEVIRWAQDLVGTDVEAAHEYQIESWLQRGYVPFAMNRATASFAPYSPKHLE